MKLLELDLPELLAVAKDIEQKELAPELLEVISPLRAFLEDAPTRKLYAKNASNKQIDERERAFLEYLHVKEQFSLSYMTNLLFLMSLHSQKLDTRSHPVMKNLLELQYVSRNIKKLDERFSDDIDLLMQVSEQIHSDSPKKGKSPKSKNAPSLAELLSTVRTELKQNNSLFDQINDNNENIDAEIDENESNSNEESNGDSEGRDSDSDADYEAFVREEEDAMNSTNVRSKRKSRKNDSSESDSDSDSSDEDIMDASEYKVTNALGVDSQSQAEKRKKQRQALNVSLGEFGGIINNKSHTNTDDALSSTSTKQNKKDVQRQIKQSIISEERGEDEDVEANDYDDDNEDPTQKINEMEQFLEMIGGAGGNGDGDRDEDGEKLSSTKRVRRSAPDDNDGSAELYEKFANKKRAYIKEKKEHYEPEARYGSMFDETSASIKGKFKDNGDDDSAIKRAATYEMMKNKGLTPHRKKANRNPRVKKRLMYDKAMVRRRGQVREVNASGNNTGSAYAGETTGIKSNLSRGRKLTT
jgi:U3 small nucleolar RNA-associated protein 3